MPNNATVPEPTPVQTSKQKWYGDYGYQILFEGVFLASLLTILVSLLLAIHFRLFIFSSIQPTSRVYLYAALGGLLGGWTFDTKWFYRAIGRLQNTDKSHVDKPNLEKVITKIKDVLENDNDCLPDTKNTILSRLRADSDHWTPERLPWRLFIPAVACFVAFAVYLAGTSGAVFVRIDNSSSGFAFSFCFILGYFSDVVVSKMANWVDTILAGN